MESYKTLKRGRKNALHNGSEPNEEPDSYIVFLPRKRKKKLIVNVMVLFVLNYREILI